MKEYTRIITELRSQVKELEERNTLLEEQSQSQPKLHSSLALKYSMDLEDKKSELNRAHTEIRQLAEMIIEQYELINQHGLTTAKIISNYSKARELTSRSPLKQTQVWAPVHPPCPENSSPQRFTLEPKWIASNQASPNKGTKRNSWRKSPNKPSPKNVKFSSDSSVWVEKTPAPTHSAILESHQDTTGYTSPKTSRKCSTQPETPSSVEKDHGFRDLERIGNELQQPDESPNVRATVIGMRACQTPKKRTTPSNKARTPPSTSKKPRSILKRTSAPHGEMFTERRSVVFAGLSPLKKKPSPKHKQRSPRQKSVTPETPNSLLPQPQTQDNLTPKHIDTPSSNQKIRPRLSKPQRSSRLMEPTFSSNQRLSKTNLASIDKENLPTPSRPTVTPLLKKVSKPLRPIKLKETETSHQ